jgi:hypothetical protein
MADYAIRHLNDIEEGTDGVLHWRPVRHHFRHHGLDEPAFTELVGS